MKRKTQILIALIALLLAAGTGWYTYRTFASMVTTAEIVSPAVTIPAGQLITRDMLTSKTVPRPLLKEDIYITPEELAGHVALVPLRPGMAVYRQFAVPPEEYRLVEDSSLEVVSFPVEPHRAVGGQVQPGHRVDIWRLSREEGARLLVEGALVVDVRAGSGQPYARQPQAVPGKPDTDSSSSSSGTALQIITVAASREVVRAILGLVAEKGNAELWVSLAPLTVGQTRVLPMPEKGVSQ
jgi:Flp pilus assembly protein CpaB